MHGIMEGEVKDLLLDQKTSLVNKSSGSSESDILWGYVEVGAEAREIKLC